MNLKSNPKGIDTALRYPLRQHTNDSERGRSKAGRRLENGQKSVVLSAFS